VSSHAVSCHVERESITLAGLRTLIREWRSALCAVCCSEGMGWDGIGTGGDLILLVPRFIILF
jgi:hypothetical protein